MAGVIFSKDSFVNNNEVSFGLVQFPVVKGSIEQNFLEHKKCIERAARNGVDVVVFPELSLTGYEPTLASNLAIDVESNIVKQLSIVAKENGVVVVSGCPLKSAESRPFIGALISYPSGKTDFCRKQHLHTGESEYFVAGKGSYFFKYNEQLIAVAICADFSNQTHAAEAKAANADVYLASVLVSGNGFDFDSQQLQGYASEHNFVVLMSNHNGETGGWKTCGKSRAWDNEGKLAVAAENDESSLVICTVSAGKVSGNVLKI